MRLLVKIGGASFEQREAQEQLAKAVRSARGYGHQVILVHGGGNQIRALTGRLGIADRYHEGLRITDAATAEAVVMVLAGQVNRTLTAALTLAGAPAVGLCGADGDSFRAKKLIPGGVDLGFVGEVTDINPRLVALMLAADIVPVIATVAPLAAGEPGDAGAFYNLNADHATGSLARAYGVEVVLFLTDVAGVRDAAGQIISTLDGAACERLQKDGVIQGGMIPKVQAALTAARANPGSIVKIAYAGIPDAILEALRAANGTRFTGIVSKPHEPGEVHRG